MNARAQNLNGALRRQFSEMYRTSLPNVYGFLSLRVGGDRALAEDLTAETFTAAVREYRNGNAAFVTESWLRTVAKRRLVDHWRRQGVARQKIVKLVDTDVDDSHGGLGDREVVVQALQRLSIAERTALVLQHVEGYSVAEVADVIGRSTKATESLLARARTKFREHYEEVAHG
ncbi:MAG: RNA polymerase sigma factor [Actinomycetota bacterium]